MEHGAGHGDAAALVVLVRRPVHHQHGRPVAARLDLLDHHRVRLRLDVLAVHLDDAVVLPQTARLGRGVRVHAADVLARLVLLRVQVEAVAVEVGPLAQVAQSRGVASALIRLGGRGGVAVGVVGHGVDDAAVAGGGLWIRCWGFCGAEGGRR